MKELSYEHFFSILGNPGRLKILQTLTERGPMNVTDIANHLSLEQSAVSHCLKKLRRCHFVEAEQNGKERTYSVNGETIRPLLGYIERHVDKYCVENCEH